MQQTSMTSSFLAAATAGKLMARAMPKKKDTKDNERIT